MGGFLDGSYPKPTELITKNFAEYEWSTIKQKYLMNLDYISWRRSDILLLGWIVGTISEKVLGLTVGLETSAKVWRFLVEHFA